MIDFDYRTMKLSELSSAAVWLYLAMIALTMASAYVWRSGRGGSRLRRMAHVWLQYVASISPADLRQMEPAGSEKRP